MLPLTFGASQASAAGLCGSDCYVDAATGLDSNDGTIGSPKLTINAAIADVTAGGTVHVAAGTYLEDVTVNKSITLVGAGSASTTIEGPIGGGGSTVAIASTGVIVDGFKITRSGNNVTDWNNAGLNSAGVAIQGAGSVAELRNLHITGMRTAIDINNSNGSSVHDNLIDDNRTGLIMRNVTDNLSVINNAITNNWTVGVLFLDASNGTNSPLQTALNSTFSGNNISGNWYGGIVDRQTGGSLPAPGANLKNFSANWLGTTTPVVTNANTLEPGYAAQIPVAFGGTATPPGGAPDIAGTASANIDFTPFLWTGTDTNAAIGFQGLYSSTGVTAAGAQTGTSTRTQEGVDTTTAAGTVHIVAGSYPLATATQINKALTIAGPNVGVSPNDAVTPATASALRVAEATLSATGNNNVLQVGAAGVTIDGLRFTDNAGSGTSNSSLIGAGGNYGGPAPGIAVTNNLFDGITRIAVYFNGPSAMDGGTVNDNRVANPTRAAGCGAAALAISGCGRQLFNLWQTDHLSFQRNVVVAPMANGDRVRVLNVNFPNGGSLQNDSPATNITIAGNTIRYSCVFTCITIAAGATNVVVDNNDITLDAGNAVQLHPTWTGGRVAITRNVLTSPNDYSIVVDNAAANVTQLTANRNSLTGGGFRNVAAAFDGTCNWWGSLTGPVPAQNSGTVTTSPFLTSANLNGPCPDVDPTISMLTPSNGGTVTKPVTISGTAADDLSVGPVEVAVFRANNGGEWWNGAAWQAGYARVAATVIGGGTTSATWSYSFNPPDTQGYFATNAVVFGSGSGYTFTPYIQFTIRGGQPTIAITAPTPNAGVDKPVSITGTAADDLQVASVEVAIYRGTNGGEWWNGTGWGAGYVRVAATVTGAGTPNATWSYSFNPADLVGQTYAVNAVVLDDFGNYTFADYQYFYIRDLVKPTVSQAAVNPTYSISSPTVAMSGSAADNVSLANASAVQVSIYRDGLWWNGTTFQAGFVRVDATVTGAGTPNATWTYSFTAPSTGTYAVTATALDTSGNFQDSAVQYFSVV